MLRLERRSITSRAAVLIAAALFPLHAQTINAGVVAITVTSSANPAVYAAPLTFTVSVTPPLASGPVPTGTVSAALPGAYTLGSATLDATGRAVIAVPPKPGLSATPALGLAAGSNTITFSYSGDVTYAKAQSAFTQFIDKANTTTAAAIDGNSQPLRLTATVSIDEPSANTAEFAIPGNSADSAPSGTVEFFNGTTLLGTATLAPASLFTSLATLPAAATPADLTAVYSGDANYNGSSSASAVQTGTGRVTLTVTASANPSVFADPVTLKIAVAPATAGAPVPTGSVTASLLGLFGLGSVTLDATGQGSLAVPLGSSPVPGIPWGFAAGSNTVSLIYSGDARYGNSKTTFTQVVSKAATATTASFGAVAAGGQSAISISATVSIGDASATPIGFALPGSNAGSSSPTGSVQFLSGGVEIGTAALSPSGHLQSTATMANTPASLSGGDIVAFYIGDANYDGSTSPPAALPSKGAASIAVTSSVSPSTFAQPVTFSVTITPATPGGPAPTGTVQAAVLGSDNLGSATLDATGHASFTVPPAAGAPTPLPWGLATGANTLTVTYSGDLNYMPGQTAFTQLVDKADTSAAVILAPVASSANSFPIVATVRIAEASVAKTPFAIPSGGNLSTSPTGNVGFFDGATLIGTVALVPGALFQSTAVLTTTAVPTSVRAVYYGDPNYNGSSSPAPAPPGGAPVTIALASSANPVDYGAPLTIAATVAPVAPGGPTPTGTLSFYDGAQNLGWIATLDSTGRGAMPIPEPLATPLVCAPTCPAAAWVMVLGAGSHTITVQYSGDANYAGLSSAALSPPISLVQQIAQAPSTTTLFLLCEDMGLVSQCFVAANIADAQPPTGGLYHFMVRGTSGLVDGDPSGSVQFFSGPTLIGKAPLTPSTLLDVTSTATLNTANGASSAVYSGDANFQGSTSACRYTLSPTQIDAPPVGASGTIAATTSCPVIALSDQTWVTATPSGSSVAYTVEANHGTSPRTATLTVGSVTVPVTQDVFSLCDLKQNGSVNVADVQLIVNQALGVTPAVNYLQGAGAAVNVVDVQIEINAALGLGCTAK